jgi:hypothetical protein
MCRTDGTHSHRGVTFGSGLIKSTELYQALSLAGCIAGDMSVDDTMLEDEAQRTGFRTWAM